MFFLGTILTMLPLKLLYGLTTAFKKVKLVKNLLKIGGIIPIPDIEVPSDALEKGDCFRVKALE